MHCKAKLNYASWPESASELYRSSDRRLSAKLVSSFADREYHLVSVTYPNSRILGFQTECYALHAA
jgi:hypothetical protein